MSPTVNASRERTLSMRPGQNAIAEAKQFGELSVTYCDAECREATTMAVVELAENLLKYSVRDATMRQARSASPCRSARCACAPPTP